MQTHNFKDLKKVQLPIASAKPNGKFVSHEFNAVYNSHLTVKNFDEFDENDFNKEFAKSLKKDIQTYPALRIAKYLGYCVDVVIPEERVTKALIQIKNGEHFVKVENTLFF